MVQLEFDNSCICAIQDTPSRSTYLQAFHSNMVQVRAAHCWCALQDGEQMCRYRIVQDGLPLLLPYVTRQLLQPTVQELLHLIEDRSLYVPEDARAVPAAAPADQQAGVEVKDEPMQQAADAAATAQLAGGSEVATGSEVKPEEAEDKPVPAEGTVCMRCSL